MIILLCNQIHISNKFCSFHFHGLFRVLLLIFCYFKFYSENVNTINKYTTYYLYYYYYYIIICYNNLLHPICAFIIWHENTHLFIKRYISINYFIIIKHKYIYLSIAIQTNKYFIYFVAAMCNCYNYLFTYFLR